MKFIVPREEFLRGLNIASRAISTNNTLPILSNILLRSESNKLYFEATNLEVAIKYFLQTDISNEGKITIPAKLFQNYISLLKDEEINIHVSEGYTVNINSSNSKTQIKGLSAEDFPQIPTVERKFEINIPTKELSESISQVVFSAATSSTRPILSGVFLHGKENTLKFVSTDSYRLSEKIIHLEKSFDEEFQSIIPSKTMIEVGRLIGEGGVDNVTLVISNNQILFKIGNIELTSRLIDGNFPNYNQIIPKESKSEAFIDKAELAQNIKRVSLFAKENNNSVKFIFSSEDQKLTVTTDATQIGSEEAEVNAKIEGEDNKIALNSEYILDFLNSIPSGEICISINNKMSPALMKHKDIDNYLHIIMPLKL